MQRQNRRKEAIALIHSGQGLSLLNQIDAESHQLELGLQAQRNRRLADNAASLLLVRKTIAVSSLVAAVIILVGILIVRLEFVSRARLEQQLRAGSLDLQSKVDERTREVRLYSAELQTEMALRKNTSDQLRLSLELAKVAIWTSFPKTQTITWAGPVEEVFGVPVDQISTYEAFRLLIHPADREYVSSLASNLPGKSNHFKSEFRIVLPNGEIRWIGGMGDAVLDENGQIARVAGINLDITARKVMEEKLATSESHFRGLAESVPQIVFAADADGEIDYQNGQWSRLTGVPNGRLTPEIRRAVFHPDDFQKLTDLRTEAARTGRPYDAEYRLLDLRRQEYRWHWLHVVPFRDEKGNVIRWFGTSTDIHQRKTDELRLAESERLLRNREQQLALVFENGSAGDYVWDGQTGEISAHPAVWALFGEPKRSGRAPADWFISRVHPDDWTQVAAALQTATSSSNTFDVEARALLPDGSIRWLSSRGFATHNSAGAAAAVIHGLVFDNTEAKLASLRIHESERQFREMADAMPQIVWRSLPGGVIDYCNARFYEYTGFPPGQPVSWEGIIYSEDLPKWRDAGAASLASGQPSAVELRVLRASNRAFRWHLIRLVPYCDLQAPPLVRRCYRYSRTKNVRSAPGSGDS